MVFSLADAVDLSLIVNATSGALLLMLGAWAANHADLRRALPFFLLFLGAQVLLLNVAPTETRFTASILFRVALVMLPMQTLFMFLHAERQATQRVPVMACRIGAVLALALLVATTIAVLLPKSPLMAAVELPSRAKAMQAGPLLLPLTEAPYFLGVSSALALWSWSSRGGNQRLVGAVALAWIPMIAYQSGIELVYFGWTARLLVLASAFAVALLVVPPLVRKHPWLAAAIVTVGVLAAAAAYNRNRPAVQGFAPLGTFLILASLVLAAALWKPRIRIQWSMQEMCILSAAMFAIASTALFVFAYIRDAPTLVWYVQAAGQALAAAFFLILAVFLPPSEPVATSR